MKFECDMNEKDLPNYKLFWVDEKQHKHVFLKFNAVDDNAAYAKLMEYPSMKDSHANYYGSIHYARCITKSGKMKLREIGGLDSPMLDDNHCWMMRLLSEIGDFFSWWLFQKPVDWWYKLKDIEYLLKHNEARSNQWNLDQHLIDSIELNLPSLIKSSHGLMFLDEAIKRLHGNEQGFDLKEYHAKHCSRYPDDVENEAMRIQNEEYNKLLLNVKLYKYYMSYGIVDADDPEQVKFDKTWRYTLPVKLGTYDEFYYDKLQDMIQEKWNAIWDWVKLHGHTLYD